MNARFVRLDWTTLKSTITATKKYGNIFSDKNYSAKTGFMERILK